MFQIRARSTWRQNLKGLWIVHALSITRSNEDHERFVIEQKLEHTPKIEPFTQLRFARKRIAATKHVNKNKDFDFEIVLAI